jgi:hypothetical protein
VDVQLDKVGDKGSPVGKSRGKYLTLALLLVWVAAVFAFTFFKFSGGGR